MQYLQAILVPELLEITLIRSSREFLPEYCNTGHMFVEFLSNKWKMWKICAGLRSVTITEIIINQWASRGNIIPMRMEPW